MNDPSTYNDPSIYLVLAAIFFIVAVVSILAGKTGGRAGWVSRAKDPTQFWWGVAIYFLAGVIGIGIYLYKVYGPSH